MGRTIDLLRDRNFFLLWSGQIISQFGDRLNQIALIALVFEKTPGSTMQLAKVLFFTVAPVFIIGPIAGVYVDRWNRKATMIGADLIRGALVFFLPLCLIRFPDTFMPVYVIIFLVYAVTRFFLPSKLAIMPDMVKGEYLIAANSLMATTRLIATMVSLALAGMLVKRIGYLGGFYLDAASYFVSALFLVLITGIKFRKTVISRAHSIGRELKEGLLHLWTNPAGRFVTVVSFIYMSAVGAVLVVIVVFIREALHLSQGTQQIGWLATILGAGLFLGVLAFGEYGYRLSRRKVIFFSFLASGIMLALFAVLVNWTGSFWIAAVFAALMGFSASPVIVLSNTLINEAIPSEVEGKVFSSLDLVIHFPLLVFMFITAQMAEHVSKTWIMTVVGLCLALLGIAGLSQRVIFKEEVLKCEGQK